MIHELKKIWRPINVLVCLILLAGMMWTLYTSMYNGAPFLRDGMVSAWSSTLKNDDPTSFVQEQYADLDGYLTKLQMQYMMSDSESERGETLAEINSVETRSGEYTDSLPFDLLILSRVKERLEHVDSLQEEWDNEQAILLRTIKRKKLMGSEAETLNARSEKYATLSVPAYANIDPYEDFVEWNTRYAYVILLPIIWIVAQNIPLEKKSGMGDMIRSIAKVPRKIACCKIAAGCFSACIIVTVQFACGLGLSICMAGGISGLNTGIQALYDMGKCYWDIPIYMLLIYQFVSQCVLAVFTASLTMIITTHIQDEWMAIPIAVFSLLIPNLLFILYPKVKALDMASVFGVLTPMSSNSWDTAAYIAVALIATIVISGYTSWRFVRRRS